MAKVEMNDSKYNLSNVDNYNNFLICNLKEIIDNYIHILLNYILLFNQKINVRSENGNVNISNGNISNGNINNQNIRYFIFKKGISTINYIFLIILYHTKNLEVAFYHAQNSYMLYIEFIEQINLTSSTDAIKITINDAIVFVYKKNIYFMNHNIENNMIEQEKIIFKQTEELLKIYSCMTDIFNSNLITLISIINNFQLNISLKNKNTINIFYDFFNILFLLDADISQKKIILFLFIDEINSRKNINFLSLKNNIQSFDFEIDDIQPKTIIDALFN